MRSGFSLISQRLFVAALLLCAAPFSRGYAKEKDVPLEKLAPLQYEAGFAEVELKAKTFIKEAHDVAGDDEKAFKKEIIRRMRHEASGSVKAYISPDGKYRPTDRHHKILAVMTVLRQEHLPLDTVEWRLDVVGDYRGKTWAQFAKEMTDNEIGYFTPEQRRGKSPADLFRRLPERFDDLKDSPARSAAGFFFDSCHLLGTWFKPWIQFILMGEMSHDGFKVPKGKELERPLQGHLQEEIFDGPHGDKYRTLLLENALPDHRAAIENSLLAAQAAWGAANRGHSPRAPIPIGANCAERYGKLATTHLSSLPRTLNFPRRSETYGQLLEKARKNCLDMVDIDRVREIVGRIAEGKRKAISSEEIKYLLESRREALVLRSAFKLLSKRGEIPADYHNFVTLLGELNDQIWKWNPKKHPSDELRDTARKLVKLTQPRVFSDGFRAATPEEFRQNQRIEFDKMRVWLDNPKLKVQEYHGLRKAVRDYRSLFSLMNSLEPRPDYYIISEKLGALSDRMGKVKDGLIDKKDKDKARGKKKKIRTKVDDDSRKEIDEFLRLAQKAVGTNLTAAAP